MNLLRRDAIFSSFAAITLLATAGLSAIMDPGRALLFGFDAGAIVFLVLMARKFRADQADAMRARAADNEPDHNSMIIIALLIALVVMVAVWVELTGKGGRHGSGIALAALSLILAWTFANTLFALHYAHVWYLKGKKGDTGGLEFPGDDPTPDYWDFAYFSFVLGMTFQVSDVQITSKRMRRLALLHGMLAFVFNIAVVALSVNLMASVLGS